MPIRALLRFPAAEADPGPDEALAACARDDAAAFEVLFERYFDQVYWYCYRTIHDREVAEDAAIQVFERAFVALPRFRPGAGTFRAWLFAIAHNLAIDEARAMQRKRTCSLDATFQVRDRSPLPEDEIVRAERDQTVQDLLPKLPDGERRVIELRLAGLTASEICIVLGQSRGSVDSAQHRAMTRLKGLVLAERLEEEARHVV